MNAKLIIQDYTCGNMREGEKILRVYEVHLNREYQMFEGCFFLLEFCVIGLFVQKQEFTIWWNKIEEINGHKVHYLT